MPRARNLVSTLLMLAFSSAGLLAENSADYDAPYQSQALEIYRHSISLRTAAGHGKVPELANYLADQLRDGGFPESDVRVLPFTTQTGEATSGLVVRYPGNGSSGKGPILLIAHMDIVDALPEDWERDPFTLIEEDGYFFGRGTLDCKFGTTMLISSFLRLKAEGFVPDRDLVIALTGDEETSMSTTRELVTTHRDLTDAVFALNADAGGGTVAPNGRVQAFRVQAAEKTYATFELTIRNPGGHSSAPRADNAIYELAQALGKIAEHRFPVQSNPVTQRYFRAVARITPGEMGEAMLRFAEDPTDQEAAKLVSTHGAFAGVTRTTCVATMLRAGHAENALPQSATATVNCRIFPGVEVDEIGQELLRVAGNPEIELTVLGDPQASPASAAMAELDEALSAVLHERYPGLPIIPFMAPYATDGRETRSAGIPTFGVNGLFMNPREIFAHGLNERVPVKAFYFGLDYWFDLLKELTGAPSR